MKQRQTKQREIAKSARKRERSDKTREIAPETHQFQLQKTNK